MSARTYVDRLKSDYRKTFGTRSGEHVLMDLYSHLQGKKSSWPASGNAHELAFNEGKRWVWLRIMEQLRIEDIAAREMLEEHIAERRREEGMEE